MNVRFTRYAGEVAAETAAALELRQSGYGDDFETELQRAVAAIGANPFLYGRTEDGPDEPETRNFYIARFQYRVIYAIWNNEAVIVDVVHAHQRPGSLVVPAHRPHQPRGIAMMLHRLLAGFLLVVTTAFVLLGSSSGLADDAKPAAPAADGYVSMFNGKDLSGWVNVNCHPGTFFVKDGEIVTTGKPTGFLRTEKQYENFELEMDWMHVEKKKMANSGLFVWGDPLPAVGTPYTRGIEVQVLANAEVKDTYTSDGDIFSIHGARCTPDRPHPKGSERCLPSEKRTRPAGEWNHYKVIANNGAIKLHVNGKEVSGVSKCTPRKGYLALESEGAECHFKNLKIKELPSTSPKPAEVATVWEGHKSIFNGLDLAGWKTEKGAWKVSGGKLVVTGKEPLVSEKAFGSIELIFDWKRPAKSDGKYKIQVGGISIEKEEKPGAWHRMTINRATNVPTPIAFPAADGLEIMNVFVRELKENK